MTQLCAAMQWILLIITNKADAYDSNVRKTRRAADFISFGSTPNTELIMDLPTSPLLKNLAVLSLSDSQLIFLKTSEPTNPLACVALKKNMPIPTRPTFI